MTFMNSLTAQTHHADVYAIFHGNNFFRMHKNVFFVYPTEFKIKNAAASTLFFSFQKFPSLCKYHTYSFRVPQSFHTVY